MPKQKPHRSKQNYATPMCFIESVKKFLGIKHFVFDFAADAANTQAANFWNERFDSLAQKDYEWTMQVESGWGWLNPPYTNIAPWAERCLRVRQTGGHIAFLVPASVGANWYRDYIHNQAYVLFLNGRIPFIPNKPTWLYPKDCMLVLFSRGYPPGCDVWMWR